jgi:pimeloyl-ACP methyl ester carboxylesterase
LARTQEVVVGRGAIEYVDLPPTDPGDGLAPLVFLHEGLGSVSLWKSFPAAVHAATGRRTVVWSRHGYGQSAVVTEPRRVDYMHDEARVVLPALFDELDLHEPILIGHSDGGSIALIHAGTPGMAPVGALVLIAPHVIVEERSIEGIAAARGTFLSTDLEQRLGRHHADPAATFWGWNDIWLSPAFRDWDITGLLAGVTCPVLAIQGVDDQYGTLRQLDLVEAGVDGGVQRVHLPECGHAPHLEQPERTRRAIVAFLDDLGR